MAGDSEKRFQKVMDKLYRAPSPKPKPPLPRGKLAAARGRQEGLRIPRDSIGSLGMVPQCRPWDREDLMRRLATFKAMTWFGKPKVVSPVNCARRGWINVEMDTIACEACGARLLFSTPSSWGLQQVEKAAAVFSLKLDNGHKLLCPWIDNVCDEALALFPPTPPTTLVEGYKERASMLIRLSALPTISSSAIEYMKSPQLEHFLSKSSHHLFSLNSAISLTNVSENKDLEAASESAFTNLYYQAQKTISLCGWEPRLLPYIVDSEDHTSPTTTSSEALPLGSSVHTSNDRRNNIIIYPSSCSDDTEERRPVPNTLGEYQYDPASIALDCKLCGACVGLWAFVTVPRPLEIFNVTVSPDSSAETVVTSANHLTGFDVPMAEKPCVKVGTSDEGDGDAGGGGSKGQERPLSLKLTIAGGPPPTKQNYKPRVSFPIVSRHLRAQFGPESVFSCAHSSDDDCTNPVNSRCLSQDGSHKKDMNGDVIMCEVAGPLKRKRSDTGDSDVRNLSHSKRRPHDLDIDVINKKNDATFPEAANLYSLGDPLLHEYGESSENQVNTIQNGTNDSGTTDSNSGHSNEEMLIAYGSVGDEDKLGERPLATADSAVTSAHVEAHDKHGGSGSFPSEKLDHDENAKSNCHDSSDIASSAMEATPGNDHGIDLRESRITTEPLITESAEVNYQKADGLRSTVPLPVDRGIDSVETSGINLKGIPNKLKEFDPIRQHRPFCPWIAPVDGKSTPGWKLTLSSLYHRDRDSSDPSSSDAPCTLLDEADDPIVSIRKLFRSSPTKRLKSSP